MRFQFSIRWIFAVTAVIGLSLGAIVGKRSEVSGTLLLLMLTAIPATAIVGIIHSSGYRRSFFIGLFVPSSLGLAKVWHILLLMGAYGHEWFVADSMSRMQATWLWGLAVATGILCVLFRWLLGKKED